MDAERSVFKRTRGCRQYSRGPGKFDGPRTREAGILDGGQSLCSAGKKGDSVVRWQEQCRDSTRAQGEDEYISCSRNGRMRGLGLRGDDGGGNTLRLPARPRGAQYQ